MNGYSLYYGYDPRHPASGIFGEALNLAAASRGRHDPTFNGFEHGDPRNSGPDIDAEDDGGHFNNEPHTRTEDRRNIEHEHTTQETTGPSPDPEGRGENPPPYQDVDYYGPQPILLDLDGNGLSVTELAASTTFIDTANDGLLHRTAWAGAGDGVLFFDADGSGDISSTREFVFTEWDPTSGSDIEALRAVFDTDGDGKLTAADDGWSNFRVMVTLADGSTVVRTLDQLGITEIDLTDSATQIELPDGSIINGTATFTYADGSTGTLGDMILQSEAQGYDVEQVESTDGAGNRVQMTTGYAAEGSIAFTIESTVAPDGSSTLNRYDDDGNGVVDRVQTIAVMTNPDGSATTTQAHYVGADTATGLLTHAKRVTLSADSTTETIERDSTGGGWYDQVEVRVTNPDDSLSITLTDYAQDGSAIRIVQESVSADGLTRSEAVDLDADGTVEYTLTHAIVVNPNGSRTETTTRHNADGSLRDTRSETIGADGRTRDVDIDADGDGAAEITRSSTIAVHADASTTSQIDLYNEDGSLRSGVTQTQSADALSQTIATDADGDGDIDHTESEITVEHADGSRTQTSTVLNGNGSLRHAEETWLADNRIESETRVDLDRDGVFDADEVLREVTLDGGTGEVTAVSHNRSTDGTTLSEETRITSADGLSTEIRRDADGDGDIDTFVFDSTTVDGSGIATRVMRTENGDGSLRSEMTQTVSVDGLTTTTEYDSDGDGVLDRIEEAVRVRNVDGSTTTTTEIHAGDGTTLLGSSVVEVSADRLNTVTQHDRNGDGAIDLEILRTEAADGSVTEVETAYFEDGSVARHSTTTMSADGLSSTTTTDADGDTIAETITQLTTVFNADGSRTETTRTENGNGTLRALTILTVSDDDFTTVLEEDTDGDGTFERTTTTAQSFDADGTTRSLETVTADDGSVLSRTQTLVSDDGLTRTVARDADGDGSFDLTTQVTTTLLTDGSTMEVAETRDAAENLRSRTETTTSDDGRQRTIEVDLDGDGSVDRITVETQADDGSLTSTSSSVAPDGGLQSQTETYVSGDGLSREERVDQDGDGTFGRVETRDVMLNADGSRVETIETRAPDGSLSTREIITTSDDGRTRVVERDVDGDGQVDFSTTETVSIAIDGVKTVVTETHAADGSLIGRSERVESADSDNFIETLDSDGNGQADTIIETDVAADGTTSQITTHYSEGVASKAYSRREPAATVSKSQAPMIAMVMVGPNSASRTAQV